MTGIVFKSLGILFKCFCFLFLFPLHIFICLYFLADVCNDYKPLTDGTRKYDYITVNSKCDDTLNGWYRFQEPAGTKMVTKCPLENRCGANFLVWFSGDHPTAAEGVVQREVCTHKNGACCESSLFIKVKNCSSYYIYKLRDVPGSCNARYCNTD